VLGSELRRGSRQGIRIALRGSCVDARDGMDVDRPPSGYSPTFATCSLTRRLPSAWLIPITAASSRGR